SIKLVDAVTGRKITDLQGFSLTFAPDSQSYALSNARGIDLRRTTDNKVIGILRGESFLDFSPDGKLVASLSGSVINVREVRTGDVRFSRRVSLAYMKDLIQAYKSGNGGRYKSFDVYAKAVLEEWRHLRNTPRPTRFLDYYLSQYPVPQLVAFGP